MERYRKRVYCEMKFLEDFISKVNEDSFEESTHVLGIWESIKSLILSNDIKLFLERNSYDAIIREIDKKRLKAAKKDKKPNLTSLESFIFDLSQKQIDQKVHLRLTDSFPSIKELVIKDEKELLNAFYLTCESKEICQKVIDEYGVLVFSPFNVEIFESVLFDRGAAVRKGDVNKNWLKLLSGKHLPSNSIVIIDNYLLNDKDVMLENLTSIFDAILPDRLNSQIPFHITIFSKLQKDNGPNGPDPYPSLSRLKNIRDLIQLIRPKLNFKLSIFKCNKDYKFHDRTILTNNVFIGCGGGFDLFKSGISQKTTTISIVYPFLNNSIEWASQAFSNIICDAKKAFQKAKIRSQLTGDSDYDFYVGDKFNRLLEGDLDRDTDT